MAIYIMQTRPSPEALTRPENGAEAFTSPVVGLRPEVPVNVLAAKS